MDTKTIGMLGTALSALIAALSYLAKTRHERTRSTRVVLYYLLEIHHLLRRAHYGLKNYMADYLEQVQTRFSSSGITLTDEEVATLQEHMRPMILAYLRAELEELSTSIAQPFEKALAELSRDDPVLAFRVRGRNQLLLLTQKVESAIGGVQHQVEASKVDAIRGGDAELDNLFREFAVTELESAIRLTAWQCDILTDVKVRLLLRGASREVSSGDLKKMVDELVDPLISKLVVGRSHPSPPNDRGS